MPGFGRCTNRNMVSSCPGWRGHFRHWIQHKPMGSSFPKPKCGLKGRFWGKHELPLLCCEPSANLSKPRTKRNREHGNASVVSHSGTSGELTSVCGVWDQCISPSSCLLPRWGGQLFMQQLHSSVCIYDLYFTSLQKVIPPDCGLCWVKSLCDFIAQSLSPYLLSVGAGWWRWSCYKWEFPPLPLPSQRAGELVPCCGITTLENKSPSLC